MRLKGFRTIIVNVIAGVLPFVSLPEFGFVIPPELYPYYALALAAANLLLRSVTTTPVGRAQ